MSSAVATEEEVVAPPVEEKGKPPKEPRGFKTFEFALMAPTLALLALLSLVPFFTLIAMSFSDVRTLGRIRLEFTGLENWVDVLTNPAFGPPGDGR